MNHRENWAISTLDTIYIFLGVYLIAVTLVFVLFLFGLDVFGILENCKLAFTKSKLWFCNAVKSKLFLGAVGFLVLVSWGIFIPAYKKHHKRYEKV